MRVLQTITILGGNISEWLCMVPGEHGGPQRVGLKPPGALTPYALSRALFEGRLHTDQVYGTCLAVARVLGPPRRAGTDGAILTSRATSALVKTIESLRQAAAAGAQETSMAALREQVRMLLQRQMSLSGVVAEFDVSVSIFV